MYKPPSRGAPPAPWWRLATLRTGPVGRGWASLYFIGIVTLPITLPGQESKIPQRFFQFT